MPWTRLTGLIVVYGRWESGGVALGAVVVVNGPGPPGGYDMLNMVGCARLCLGIRIAMQARGRGGVVRCRGLAVGNKGQC